MKKYDYIIIGAGCAGLSLLMRLMDVPGFSEKKVLLVDKEKKENNDRTWSFWEKGQGYFEDIVHKSWPDILVKNDLVNIPLGANGYTYKMIRGIDFYNHCFSRISNFSNIEYVLYDVLEVINQNGKITMITNAGTLEAEAGFVFTSAFRPPPKSKKKYCLLQHFKGWQIKTETAIFNPSEAVLMDFSVDQKNYPAAFAYVLPLTSTRALIEYTVFSDTVLDQYAYDGELEKYLQHALSLTKQSYSIEHIEFGIIPMSNHTFPQYKNGLYYIGTAGGQTKPSTGYTFQFIQKQASHLSSALANGKQYAAIYPRAPYRFKLYDSILLDVLNRKKNGSVIFMRLFQRVPAALIFKFLDNETSFAEDIKILSAMDTVTFTPAALREIMKLVQ